MTFAKKVKLTVLPTTAMSSLASFKRSEWAVDIPSGLTLSEILEPSFWAHHVNKLRKGDIVEAISVDGAFDVDLRVIDKSVGFVKMRVLRKWERPVEVQVETTQQAPTEAGTFPCVDYRNATGWRVLGFDGNTVKDQLSSKEDAERELAEYNRRAKAA